MKRTVLVPNVNRVRGLRCAQIYVDSVNHAAPHESTPLDFGFRLRVGRRVIPWEKCFDTIPDSDEALTDDYLNVLTTALCILSDWQDDDEHWSVQIVTAEPRVVDALREQMRGIREIEPVVSETVAASMQVPLKRILLNKPSLAVGMILMAFTEACVLLIDEEDRESFRTGNGLRLL